MHLTAKTQTTGRVISNEVLLRDIIEWRTEIKAHQWKKQATCCVTLQNTIAKYPEVKIATVE